MKELADTIVTTTRWALTIAHIQYHLGRKLGTLPHAYDTQSEGDEDRFVAAYACALADVSAVLLMRSHTAHESTMDDMKNAVIDMAFEHADIISDITDCHRTKRRNGA